MADGVHVVGLRQIIEGAAPDGLHRPLHVAEGGHQDHRDVGGQLLQPLQELDAVQIRHPDVGDHQVGGLAGELGQGLSPVGGGMDLMTFGGEHPAQQVSAGRVVIHHEDARPLSHPSLR